MRRARLTATALAVALSGCAATSSSRPVATLRPACPAEQPWTGSACAPPGDGEAALDRAAAALAEFRVNDALKDLDRARAAGPYRHEVLVRLYEQLGIAYAYQKDEARAMQAFETLLALDPGHLLPYTLSPQVTFLFERARKDPKRAQPAAVDLSWPRHVDVSHPVPIDVEVLRDPTSELARASIEVRKKGEPTYRAVDLELARPGSYRRVELPPVGATHAEVLELHLRAYDAKGNEVLRWASAETPREIPLGYRPPPTWYRKWWVWALAGGAVAAGTGITVYLLSIGPPDTLGGMVGINR